MKIASHFPTELFKGKTVFVTGGGSGINLGIARNFAALGANIAICGRTQAKLDTAAVVRAWEPMSAGRADVRDFAALEAAFARPADLGP
jgi:NAD(P)-dependent dehydrogenase (short-subunit alcohol dehydrogenase family)